MTAGMQALGGLQTRGEGESAEAGEVYATLAMAAAARQSPAALGAAERAHTLTAGLPAADPARKRARTAWSALGSPRRLPVTDELVDHRVRLSPVARRRVRARRRGRRRRPAQPRHARRGRARVSRRDRHRRRSPGARRRAASRSPAAPAAARCCASSPRPRARGRRARARRRRPRRAARGRRRRARRRRRTRRARSQRPLPVRLGVEVQEVLRALTRYSPGGWRTT